VNGQDFAAHVAAYVTLAASALAAGTALGIPLGVAAARAPFMRVPVLLLGNLARVVPSLALLTFMLPLLGVGFTPAFVALSMLAMAPIIIGTDIALRSVPAAVLEAARGMGMTRTQQLLRVEWPLAVPIVYSSVRTAATEVIASAVLASFIGAGGLGEYITTGLMANQPEALWTGVAAIATIAILTEAIFAAFAKRIGETA
jgi:osmoprotectant transport system permease protein